MQQNPPKNKLKSRLGPWVAGLFFVLTAGGLVCLGAWQLQRAVWKQTLVNQSDVLRMQPPQPLNPTQPYPLWQPLHGVGQFDTAREVVLESQLNPQGAPGYRLITPLLLNNTTEILVDRGWIPRDFSAGFLERYAPQQQQVTGVVRAFPQRHGWLQGPTESYGAAHTLVFFDPAAIPLLPGVTRLEYYLQASSATHPGVVAFVEGPAQRISPAQHRQYAWTWLACASLWLACGVYYAFTSRPTTALKVSATRGAGQKGPTAATPRGK